MSKQQDPQPVTEDVDDLDDDTDDTDVTVEVADDNDVQEDVEDEVDEVSEVSNDIDVATVAAIPITNTTVETINENDPNPINKYCTCSQSTCKCCREIGLPILPIRGPGCATMQYLEDDKMLVTVQYGDFVIAQRQISGLKIKLF